MRWKSGRNWEDPSSGFFLATGRRIPLLVTPSKKLVERRAAAPGSTSRLRHTVCVTRSLFTCWRTEPTSYNSIALRPQQHSSDRKLPPLGNNASLFRNEPSGSITACDRIANSNLTRQEG